MSPYDGYDDYDEPPRRRRRRRGPHDARGVALLVLGQLEEEEAFLQPALQSAAAKARLDARDRGLALELVMGVERWRLRLDHALAPHVQRGLEQTEPTARRLLRLAAYQLLFLDRIPPRAAVHSAVELARSWMGERAAGFVNGVLRGLTRSEPSWPEGDDVASIAVRTSTPEWLVARWSLAGGAAFAVAMAEAHNRPAPLTVRAAGPAPDRDALAERLRAEGATVQATAHAPDGLHVSGHPSPFEGAAFRDGWWQAQDEASQLVVRLLDPQPGERVWDACAAPGGKTRYISRLMGDRGAVVATDVHPTKAERLGRALRGRASVAVHHRDVVEGPPPGERFDRVLLDAPCTALGIMRRHPEIKWRRGPADIEARAALQARLLDAAADAVRPGGLLVYSVCSDTAEEGPDQLAAFVERRPDFTVERPDDTALPLADDGTLRLDPHRHGADGFFAARLRRDP